MTHVFKKTVMCIGLYSYLCIPHISIEAAQERAKKKEEKKARKKAEQAYKKRRKGMSKGAIIGAGIATAAVGAVLLYPVGGKDIKDEESYVEKFEFSPNFEPVFTDSKEGVVVILLYHEGCRDFGYEQLAKGIVTNKEIKTTVKFGSLKFHKEEGIRQEVQIEEYFEDKMKGIDKELLEIIQNDYFPIVAFYKDGKYKTCVYSYSGEITKARVMGELDKLL